MSHCRERVNGPGAGGTCGRDDCEWSRALPPVLLNPIGKRANIHRASTRGWDGNDVPGGDSSHGGRARDRKMSSFGGVETQTSLWRSPGGLRPSEDDCLEIGESSTR